MNKWTVILVALPVVAILGTYAVLRTQPDASVEPYQVRRGTLSRTARGVGKIEGVTGNARLAFTVSGLIKAVHVEEGETVTQGMALAELHAEPFQVEVAKAKAALEQARAAEKHAALPALPAELAQAQERLERAKLDVKAATIRVQQLEKPAPPPPAPAWRIEQAQYDAEQAKFRMTEAVHMQDKMLQHTPSKDELAVALANVNIAEWELEDAKQKLAAAERMGFATSTYGLKPDLVRVELTNHVERANRRLAQVRAEYDRVRRGPSEQDKEAAKARATVAQQAYQQALAARKALENPEPPPPATEHEILLAKAELDKARAAEREAQAGLDLLKALPREENVAAAKAATALAEESLAQAELSLAAASLLAPFDGTVVGRYYEPGSAIQAHTPVLALADLKHLRVRAEIPVDWTGDLKENQEVSLSTPAFAGEELSGKIARILGTVGPKSIFSHDPGETRGGEVATILVELSEPKTDHAKRAIRAGLRVNVIIAFETRENVVTVPKSYVTYEDGRHVVYRHAGGKAEPKEVEVGFHDDWTFEIVKGVDPGDILIKSPRKRGR